MADAAAPRVPEGLVDFAVLDAWMDEQGLPPGEITEVAPIPGGTQNVLVRFQRRPREYVLRRPPRHLRKASNEVLRREAGCWPAWPGPTSPSPGWWPPSPAPT